MILNLVTMILICKTLCKFLLSLKFENCCLDWWTGEGKQRRLYRQVYDVLNQMGLSH